MKRIWVVFIFIIKCTLIGFGGGNALLPVIKREAVDRHKWLSNQEFNNLAIATNSIPGPSVVESLSYIAMKQLGKVKGMIVTLLALLPHILLALFVFIFTAKYLPQTYLIVIAALIMPVIAGVLFAFGLQYLRASDRKFNKRPLWIAIFLLTLIFTLFIPAPYNVPVIVMIVVILCAYWYSRIKGSKRLSSDSPN